MRKCKHFVMKLQNSTENREGDTTYREQADLPEASWRSEAGTTPQNWTLRTGSHGETFPQKLTLLWLPEFAVTLFSGGCI